MKDTFASSRIRLEQFLLNYGHYLIYGPAVCIYSNYYRHVLNYDVIGLWQFNFDKIITRAFLRCNYRGISIYLLIRTYYLIFLSIPYWLILTSISSAQHT